MAIPGNLETPYTVLNPETTALLVIDTQNDFGHPDGARSPSDAAEKVPRIARIVEMFRKAGNLIIHVIRLYEEDGRNVDPCRRWQVEQGKLSAVVPGTWGSQPCEEVVPEGVTLDTKLLLSGRMQKVSEIEYILYKSRLGAFHGTHLAKGLRYKGIDSVVIVGITFANCVRATQFGATDNDFRVGLVPEAVTLTNPDGLAAMQAVGVQMMEIDELEAWLEGKCYKSEQL